MAAATDRALKLMHREMAMRSHLRNAGLISFVFALGLGPARADFDDGLAAYERRDYAAALTAWLPLAERGDSDAQLRVGQMLPDRQGVRWREFERAAAWFRRAALQHQPEAQYALARLHYEGFLVPRDAAEMWAMLEAAARLNHARAQLTLGVIYEYGFGDIDADLTEALKWYELAAGGGIADVDAKLTRLRQRVRSKMTDAEIAAALKLAAAWVPAR
jgi:TPR repeat protein